jgi:6-phosphofructokinase
MAEAEEVVETETDALGEETVEAEEGAEESTETEDTEESGEEGEEDAQASAPTRGETRLQKLANEARTEREARIRAEARAEALEQSRSAAPADTAEAERLRAEKLALMDPVERKVFEQSETIRRLEQGQQMTQIQIADSLDQSKFMSLCASNPVAKKHSAEVETVLANMRRSGTNAPRETVLAYVVGQAALKTAASPKTAKQVAVAKAAATARVNSAKGTATSAKGDTGGAKKGEETLEQMRSRLLQREQRGDYF